MKKHNSLEHKIWTWLDPFAKKTGFDEVIFASQNAPQPDQESFVVVDILGTTTDGRSERILENDRASDDLKESLIYRGMINIEVRCYSDNSIEMAEELKTRLWGLESSDMLNALNIGLGSTGVTQNRTYLEPNTSYVQRADFSIRIHYAKIYTNKIGTIEHIPIKGTNAENGDIIMDETIDKP